MLFYFFVGEIMKEFAKSFYNSKAWQDVRDMYIKERIRTDGGFCEVCHDELGYIVHHKILLTESNINDANISLNVANLQYVCKPCHDRMEDHFVKPRDRRYSFNTDGQMVYKK